jgi:hypothetical protein
MKISNLTILISSTCAISSLALYALKAHRLATLDLLISNLVFGSSSLIFSSMKLPDSPFFWVINVVLLSATQAMMHPSLAISTLALKVLFLFFKTFVIHTFTSMVPSLILWIPSSPNSNTVEEYLTAFESWLEEDFKIPSSNILV